MPTNRKSIKTFGSSRLVHIRGEVDDKSAGEVIDNLIKLDKASNKDILLVIDSNGGDLDRAVSICQIIKLLRCDVATLALSTAASSACLLLAAGKKGKRLVLDNTCAMMHETSLGETKENFHSVLKSEIYCLEVSNKVVNGLLIEQGIKDPEKYMKPAAFYMLGKEIIAHGFADKVIKSFDEIVKYTNI